MSSRLTSVLFFGTLLSSSVGSAATKESFLTTWKTPTILILQNFKKACRSEEPKLDFAKDEELKTLLDLKKLRTDPIRIRALIFSAAHCTEGDSKSQVLEFLGVQLLTEQPKLLIHGLHNEKSWDVLSAPLAQAEPLRFSGSQCETPECQQERKEILAKKRTALESVKIRKVEEPIRKKLIGELKAEP